VLTTLISKVSDTLDSLSAHLAVVEKIPFILINSNYDTLGTFLLCLIGNYVKFYILVNSARDILSE